jgi:nucleoside-triphosphatase
MQAQKLFVTGPPRSGKSVLVMEVAEELGFRLGGISTPEILEGGERKGFAIKDLKSGRKGILASKALRSPANVGSYGVNLADLDSIGSEALENACVDKEVDLIVIDEIGKMELFSKRFKEAVMSCLRSNKRVLAVLHRDYVKEFKRYGEVLNLTPENRAEVKKRLLDALR